MLNSNPNSIRITGALLFSLLAHGLVLGLATRPDRQVVPALNGRKVVMRLTARKAMPPRPEPVRPLALPAARPSGLSRPQPVKANPPAPLPLALPAPEVTVRELPTPMAPQEFFDAARSTIADPLPAAADHNSEAASAQGAEILARPLYRQNPPPEYPALARRRQWQGTVVLEVLVSAEGRVGEVAVQQSSGHLVLDRAALKVVGYWLFDPGRRGGKAVAMKVLVPVRFGLK